MNFAHVAQMIDDCNDTSKTRNHSFSKWELEFIESVTSQFEEKDFLTETQIEKLEQIWDKI